MTKAHNPPLDALDRKILNRIQESVPLAARPFQVLAEELGLTEEEVLRRVRRLRDSGVVRRLGPIINYSAWGMAGTLVAANLEAGHIEEAKRAVEALPEITHAYLRDHPWNFWFTVVAENEESRDAIIDHVAAEARLKDVRKLKRRKSFKLKVKFRL